jgi:hypothetical protein
MRETVGVDPETGMSLVSPFPLPPSPFPPPPFSIPLPLGSISKPERGVGVAVGKQTPYKEDLNGETYSSRTIQCAHVR